MTRKADNALEPSWVNGATPKRAFLHGLLGARSVPVLVVAVTFVGFGALARDSGLDIFQAMFVTATVFALPGQVVLVDEIAKGAGMLGAAFAVCLTAIRLTPMSFSLFPVMRGKRSSRLRELLLGHFVAITVWLESMRRLPQLPRELRMAYFSGFVLAMLFGLSAATVIGFLISANVPTPVAAGMVFLTPIYFFLSLVESAQSSSDKGAVLAGTVLGPIAFMLMPGFDLLATGVIGGSLAYLLMRKKKQDGRQS